MIFKRLSFYLAIAGIIGAIFMVKRLRHVPPAPPPFSEPSRSPYAHSLAATGIIEARGENVKISTIKAGLVRMVFVNVGSEVKKGEPLLQLDNREAEARLGTARSQLQVLEALLKMEQVQLADLEDQNQRISRLERDKVVSEDESKRKQFSVESAKARLAKVEADTKALRFQIEQAQVEVEVLTVRAPRDGTVLQLNIREGEYANVVGSEPVMILGETRQLQIRADIDEQNAPLVQTNQPAVAFLKGETGVSFPLRFVRVEPFVIPKRSLTGDSAERVDTRVLQIIFQMDRPDRPLYVGQQVDVFIQRSAPARTFGTNAVAAGK